MKPALKNTVPAAHVKEIARIVSEMIVLNINEIAGNEEDQQELDTSNEISPDYGHLHQDYRSHQGLCETIDHSLRKAEAIIELIKGSFGKDRLKEDNEVLFYAILSVTAEIKNIEAVIDAFDKAKDKEISLDEALVNINTQSLSSIHGVLGLLSREFENDDSSKPETVIGALNAVQSQIVTIRKNIYMLAKMK